MHRSPSLQSLIGLFSRFRTILILVVVCILGVTAAAFMIFTQREVTRSMLNKSDEEARNIMRVIMLDLAEHETGLRYFRDYARDRYEQQLRNLVSVVVSQVDYFHNLYERGIMTEEQARKAALDSVQRMRFGHDDYFFIYDRNNVAVSHPDPKVRGRDMSATTDVNGRPVAKTMWAMAEKEQNFFLTLWWTRLGEKKPVPKLLYFYHYPKWDWMIGTGLYIDDIERDVDRKKAEILNVLKQTFSRVRIAESGYFSLFDGKGKILIHPFLENTDGFLLKDAVTQRSHLRDLIEASKNPDVPYKYLWNKPDRPDDYHFLKYSHIERFAPFDWYVSSSLYQDEMEKPAVKIVQRQQIFVGVVVLLSIIGVYLLVTRVTAPLARLTNHAASLQKSDFAVSAESSKQLLSFRFPAEIAHLAGTFWNMEQRLEAYLKSIKETTAAREKLESELRIARDIQMSMLPDAKTALAGRTEIELAAILEPAREVGGDLYDFFFLDDDRFCFMVGDVSDKGVPAALFMARSKALLHSAARMGSALPGRILKSAQAELSDGNEKLMFITLFLGILNTRTGELFYANAGHVPPILFNENGRYGILELPPGRPLGIGRRGNFATQRRLLNPGEGLLVFTDGVTEAQSKEEVFFGDDRLMTLLVEKEPSPGPGSASRYVETVMNSVKAFCAGADSQSDDIALMCIRYTGNREGQNEPADIRRTIAGNLDQVIQVLDEMDGFMKFKGLPEEAAFDVRVAVEELLVNIVRHAFDGSEGDINLRMVFEHGSIRLTIDDPGHPFNPLEFREPERQNKERKLGGLGLRLARNLVDELSYERRESRNILNLTKNI